MMRLSSNSPSEVATAAGVTFFCVAWFFSSLLNSPAIAVWRGWSRRGWPGVVWLSMWAYGSNITPAGTRPEILTLIWSHRLVARSPCILGPHDLPHAVRDLFCAGGAAHLRRAES